MGVNYDQFDEYLSRLTVLNNEFCLALKKIKKYVGRKDTFFKKSAVNVIKISRADMRKTIEAIEWMKNGSAKAIEDIGEDSALKSGLAEKLSDSINALGNVMASKAKPQSNAIHARAERLRRCKESMAELTVNFRDNRVSFDGMDEGLKRISQTLGTSSGNMPVYTDDRGADLNELKIALSDCVTCRKELEDRLSNR